MIKDGKWGQINDEANVEIKQQCKERKICSCEAKLDKNCWGKKELHPHHKHKRIWYRAAPWLLSDFSQWINACPYCHDVLEKDKELTKKTFQKLRPKIISKKAGVKKFMNKKTKLPKAMAQKVKKADWMRPHACIHCKTILSGAWCNHCNNLSIKN